MPTNSPVAVLSTPFSTAASPQEVGAGSAQNIHEISPAGVCSGTFPDRTRLAYVGNEWREELASTMRGTLQRLFSNPTFRALNPILTEEECDALSKVDPTTLSPAVLASVSTKPFLLTTDFAGPGAIGPKQKANYTAISMEDSLQGINLRPWLHVHGVRVSLSAAAMSVFRPDQRPDLNSLGSNAYGELTLSHTAGDLDPNCPIARTNINPWMATYESIARNKSRESCSEVVWTAVRELATDPSDSVGFASVAAGAITHTCGKHHCGSCMFIDWRRDEFQPARESYAKTTAQQREISASRKRHRNDIKKDIPSKIARLEDNLAKALAEVAKYRNRLRDLDAEVTSSSESDVESEEENSEEKMAVTKGGFFRSAKLLARNKCTQVDDGWRRQCDVCGKWSRVYPEPRKASAWLSNHKRKTHVL
jgi:hypothetical protein